MNCRHTIRVYTEWREGAISAWDRFALRLHLFYCSGCAEYVEQMDRTVKALRDLGRDDAGSPPPPENLLESFRGRER